MLLRFLVVSASLVAAAAVTAQSAATSTSSSSTTASSTTTAAIQTHSVAVGANGFKFDPDNITVPVGDVVEFVFYPGGHSVARSEYLFPCMPYENYGLNRVGFFSGPETPAVYTSDGPKFRIRINDTTPIFYYCTAPGSCYKQHMIGVINPNSTQTFENQEDAVLQVTTQIAPGQPIPSETLPASSSPPAATTTPTSASAVPAASSNSSSGSSALSSGAIAGIAIGAAAVAVLAAALLYLCGRNSRPKTDGHNRTSFAAAPMMDAKFTSPKSPGQETFISSNAHYSLPPGNDPYRPSPYAARTPPVSPGYAPYQNLAQHPPWWVWMDHSFINHSHHNTPSPAPYGAPTSPPVELPTSGDPGNSPVPPYADATNASWQQGQETKYPPAAHQP